MHACLGLKKPTFCLRLLHLFPAVTPLTPEASGMPLWAAFSPVPMHARYGAAAAVPVGSLPVYLPFSCASPGIAAAILPVFSVRPVLPAIPAMRDTGSDTGIPISSPRCGILQSHLASREFQCHGRQHTGTQQSVRILGVL